MYRFSLAFFFLLCATLAVGQSRIASIERLYFEGDIAAADSLLQLLEKNEDRRLRSDAAFLKLKGIYHYYHLEVESAVQKLLLAFDLADRTKNALLQSEISEWLGHVYMKRNEPDVAIRVYKESLQIRNDAKLSGGMSDFYLNFFLAAAHYAWSVKEKELEELPFLRTNWKQGSKPLKVSAYDSLIFPYIKKAIKGIPSATAQTNYQPTLLLTTLPQLAISPDLCEGLLNNLMPHLKEETKYSRCSAPYRK